jgi:hypothetical protein
MLLRMNVVACMGDTHFAGKHGQRQCGGDRIILNWISAK